MFLKYCMEVEFLQSGGPNSIFWLQHSLARKCLLHPERNVCGEVLRKNTHWYLGEDFKNLSSEIVSRWLSICVKRFPFFSVLGHNSCGLTGEDVGTGHRQTNYCSWSTSPCLLCSVSWSRWRASGRPLWPVLWKPRTWDWRMEKWVLGSNQVRFPLLPGTWAYRETGARAVVEVDLERWEHKRNC